MPHNDPPKRKHPRLKDIDYGKNGLYFVTICSHERQNIFSFIPTENKLAPALTLKGMVLEEQLQLIIKYNSNLILHKHVIMPNHIHLLLELVNNPAGASPRPTNIMGIIGAYKSLTTRICNQIEGISGRKIWQNSFYDHIIRDEADYLAHWNYIDSNLLKWEFDKYY